MKIILTKEDFSKEDKELENLVLKLAQHGIGIFIDYDYNNQEVVIEYYDLAQERFFNSLSSRFLV